MGAAAELERRFAAQGPATEGSFRVPPEPDMDPTPGSGPPSHRKSSLEMPQRMAELRGNIMSSLSLSRHRDRDGGGGGEGRSKGNSPSPPRSPRGAGGGGFGGAGGLMRTLSGGLRHKIGDSGGDGAGVYAAARVSPRIPAMPSPTPSFRDADAEDEQPGLPVSTSAPGNGKAAHVEGDHPPVDVSAAAAAAAAARDKAAREARHAGRGALAGCFFCCCPLAGCGGLDDVDVAAPGAATPLPMRGPPAASPFQPALSRVSERVSEEQQAALSRNSTAGIGGGATRGSLPMLDAAEEVDDDEEDDGSLVFYDVRENFSVYSGYSGAADSRAQSDVEE